MKGHEENSVSSGHVLYLDQGDGFISLFLYLGFPGGSEVKSPPANAGDVGLIPVSGRSPGGGYGNLLQYSCLEIPWTEEPGRLWFMGLQKCQTQLSD